MNIKATSFRLFTLLLVLLAAALPVPGFAQGQGAVSLAARAGYDGYCKENAWLPVHVLVENQGPGLEGRLEAHVSGFSGDESVYARPVSLPNTSRKEITLYVYHQTSFNNLVVSLVSAGKTLTSASLRLTCASAGDVLIGVLAASPSAFNVLSELDPPNGKALIAQLGTGDLPDLAPALQPLDVLVISGVDTGQLTQKQIDALSAWLAGGGKLIVSGGPAWQKTAAGLHDLLPLVPDSAQTLPSLEALRDFTGEQLASSGDVAVATGALQNGAEVVIDQAGIPLVVSRQIGLGKVVYLAADPALEPLRSWAGSAVLYQKLLSDTIQAPAWSRGIQNWDFAATAAATLPNLALPPIGLVLGFLAVYILAIGPLNYLFLRLLKRRELAWLTIPAVVLIFSGLAFLIGSRSRGAQPVLSRLAIVQVWAGSAQARVDGLAGVFSPRRQSYRVSAGPGFLAHALSGGSRMAGSGGWLFLQNGEQGSEIPDLRIDVAGISAIGLEGNIPATPLSEDLALELDGNNARLTGSLTNTSGRALKDAVLLAPGGVQRLGEIKPNEKRAVQIALQTSGHAAQAGQGALTPAVPAYPYGYTGTYAFPVPGSDPILFDLIGTQDYYRSTETYRRFNLLNAVVTSMGRFNTGGRGGGIYLAGWTDDSPLPISLGGSLFTAQDTTLYLFSLSPRLSAASDRIVIPPGLFTWNVIQAGPDGNATPYDAYLSQGGFSLRFGLAQPVSYQSVESLTLHLSSYGAAGPSGLRLSLWDHTTGAWVQLPELEWGDHDIPEPEHFIGPGGDIRLQVSNPRPQSQVSIETCDFTLVVKQ